MSTFFLFHKMTYSDDIINLVVYSVKEGSSATDVSKRFKISIKTVRRWLQKYSDKVNVNMPIRTIRKRINRKFDKYADKIVNYVKQNIGCSIHDIYLYGCGKEISLSTISRIAKSNGIVHKRISNKIICKDVEKINEDRKIFVQQMNYNMKDVILCAQARDEVSFCINDHQRYGYGFSGEDIIIQWKHKQNRKRLTTIAAISNLGIYVEQ